LFFVRVEKRYEMIDFIIIKSFIIALLLGSLIGLEREYALYRKRGHSYAGIRTFPLIAILGALSAYFGQTLSPWILYISLLVIGIIIIFAYYAQIKEDRKHTGATSEIAGFLTFFVGMLTFYGEVTFAVTLTITMTLILYARSLLHHFAEKITKEELRDTLIFALLVFVIMPFLSNKWYGPLELFNPYLTWMMIILVCGISFIGYVLIKWFGDRGIGLAGILGGLVSSTATTFSFTERSRKEKSSHALALGVILANGVMYLRFTIVASIINYNMFLHLLLPVLVLVLTTIVFSLILWKKIKRVKGNVALTSPIALIPALKFGVLLSAIIALVRIFQHYFAEKGIYLLSILSGLADLDVITVSLSQLTTHGLTLATATTGILLASIANMALKGGVALWRGERKFGQIIIGFFLVLITITIGFIVVL